MGRFKNQHDPFVLLAIADEVLRAADPEHPDRVSQRAYDATRVLVGHEDSPRADKLAARFKVGWEVFRDRVLHREHPAYALSMAGKQQVRRVLTRAEAVAAIKRVATYREATTLSVPKYEAGRIEIDRRALGRHKHGAHLIPLPQAHVITQRFKWPEVTREAGLDVATGAQAVLPRAAAVVAVVEHYGFRPRQADVEWFGKHHRIQMVMRVRSPHSESIAEAERHFADQGRWFPPAAPNAGRPADWQGLADGAPDLVALARAFPRKRTRADPWTIEEIRVVISRAFDALGPGERLTIERYKLLARGDGFPTAKTIIDRAKQSGTSFPELVRTEAAIRARRRAR